MWRRTSSLAATTSNPATSARPEVGLVSVQSMLIVVVLPAPLGPRKPKTSPLPTSKSTPLTASKSPKDLRRLLTEIAGAIRCTENCTVQCTEDERRADKLPPRRERRRRGADRRRRGGRGGHD